MSHTQRVASPRNSLTSVWVQDKGIAAIMKIYLTYCLMSIHSVLMDANSVYNRMGVLDAECTGSPWTIPAGPARINSVLLQALVERDFFCMK